MATTSKKFTLDWQDALKGLLMAVLTPLLGILATGATGSFTINWTDQWHLAVQAGTAYLLKNFFSGPSATPPSGLGQIGKKTFGIIAILLLCAIHSSGQSLLHPLPRYKVPVRVNPYVRGIIGPTDTLPSLSVNHWQGFRLGGPDVAIAIPDLSVYTGIGLDFVWAVANTTTQKWDYQATLGLRLRGGANLPSPGMVKAIGAIGLRASFFKGLLAVEGLYNLTMKTRQAAFGNPTALIPGLN